MRLMVVDDSNIMRRAIAQYLDSFELELIGMAGDGRAALELFDQGVPDLVTLDVTMPEMDGLACLQEMLKRRPEVKVIVISALADEATALRALKLGARAFINKPFTRESLRETLAEVVGAPV